jgi:UDP-N-acetyl-D-mannosaminuronic acid transferase (WecB/TagA/CpsF family)
MKRDVSASVQHITILALQKHDYSMPVTMAAEEISAVPTKQALGIKFFDGTADEAVDYISSRGGLVVAPAAPSFIALQNDPEYRHAIADADLAIADSGWMVNFWWLLRRERLKRISGLKFFKRLLARPECREPEKLFWILPSGRAKEKTLSWSEREKFPTTADDCYVAPRYPCSRVPAGRANEDVLEERGSQSRGYSIQDEKLLATIRERQPTHIIVAIGGGMQDKIGSYLKHHCGYHPAIHCIGAAPGFVTGDQVRIPMWADRFYLGWLFRVFVQPRALGPRFWSARKLPWLIWKYREQMPELSPR